MEIISQEMRQMKTKLHGRAQIELSQARLAQYRRENAGNEMILHQQRSDNETRKGLAILLGEQNLAKTDIDVNDSDDEVNRQNSTANSNLVVFRR